MTAEENTYNKAFSIVQSLTCQCLPVLSHTLYNLFNSDDIVTCISPLLFVFSQKSLDWYASSPNALSLSMVLRLVK